MVVLVIGVVVVVVVHVVVVVVPVVDPRNIPIKFGQNQVSNSRDLTDIEFAVVVVVVVCRVKPNFRLS